MTLNHIFITLARHFFAVFLFFGMGLNHCYATQNYKIISRATVSDFWFLEDGTWGDDSKTLQLKSFAAKPIILHFWSTHCPPCLEEMASLNKVIGEMGGNDVQFVTVNVDNITGGKLKNFLSERGWSHITPYTNPGFTRPKINGLPTTFFINGDFEMVGQIEGMAAWESDEMKRLIRRLGETGKEVEKSLWEKLKDYVQKYWSALELEKNYPIVSSLKKPNTVKKR